MALALLKAAIRIEQDVVSARQRARSISALLGFDLQDQARIATAVSEIARNALRFAGGGEIGFALEGDRPPQLLAIAVDDRGPGIAGLDAVLDGSGRPAAGAGLGILGARRLMDDCTIRSDASGTSVVMKKVLPEGARFIGPREAAELAGTLAARIQPTAFEEVQQQNRELIRALGDLREKQEELLALNRELEDTNRGVVALYAELAARADALRRADETRTRFLSNVSHEFRTPLNSIRALTALLLERADGPLNAEQELQVKFIATGADELAALVDDLLDLAKIDAGRIEVRVREFTVEEVFGALRGMLRPLLTGDHVALHFDAGPGLPAMRTDEGKVSQILRNLVSNALKYTEEGEIRVSARASPDGSCMVFAVADTGIGIAEGDREIIFEEFVQVPNPLQAKHKGTGLGLPLCRRFAAVLGGEITLESTPGRGSTFTLAVPCEYAGEAAAGRAGAPPHEAARIPVPAVEEPPEGTRILVIDDDPASRYAIVSLAGDAGCQVLEAADAREGLLSAALVQPDLIVLDLDLPDRRGEEVLRELAGSEATRDIPVVVVTSEALTPAKEGALRVRAAEVLSKAALGRGRFRRVIAASIGRPARRVP